MKRYALVFTLMLLGLPACGDAMDQPEPADVAIVEIDTATDLPSPEDDEIAPAKADAPPQYTCRPATCEWSCGSGPDSCGGTLHCEPCGEPTDVFVMDREFAMVRGQTSQIDASVFDENHKRILSPTITFTSSKRDIADVKEDGTVFAVNEGSTFVSIEVADGVTEGVTIDVMADMATIESRANAGCPVDEPC